MLVQHQTIFSIVPPEFGEQTTLRLSASGQLVISLSTPTFIVDYNDGKASVLLSRYLTSAQARQMGQSLINEADRMEAARSEFAQNFATPAPEQNCNVTVNDDGVTTVVLKAVGV